jgi:hypothetical protein
MQQPDSLWDYFRIERGCLESNGTPVPRAPDGSYPHVRCCQCNLSQYDPDSWHPTIGRTLLNVDCNTPGCNHKKLQTCDNCFIVIATKKNQRSFKMHISFNGPGRTRSGNEPSKTGNVWDDAFGRETVPVRLEAAQDYTRKELMGYVRCLACNPDRYHSGSWISVGTMLLGHSAPTAPRCPTCQAVLWTPLTNYANCDRALGRKRYKTTFSEFFIPRGHYWEPNRDLKKKTWPEMDPAIVPLEYTAGKHLNGHQVSVWTPPPNPSLGGAPQGHIAAAAPQGQVLGTASQSQPTMTQRSGTSVQSRSSQASGSNYGRTQPPPLAPQKRQGLVSGPSDQNRSSKQKRSDQHEHRRSGQSTAESHQRRSTPVEEQENWDLYEAPPLRRPQGPAGAPSNSRVLPAPAVSDPQDIRSTQERQHMDLEETRQWFASRPIRSEGQHQRIVAPTTDVPIPGGQTNVDDRLRRFPASGTSALRNQGSSSQSELRQSSPAPPRNNSQAGGQGPSNTSANPVLVPTYRAKESAFSFEQMLVEVEEAGKQNATSSKDRPRHSTGKSRDLTVRAKSSSSTPQSKSQQRSSSQATSSSKDRTTSSSQAAPTARASSSRDDKHKASKKDTDDNGASKSSEKKKKKKP